MIGNNRMTNIVTVSRFMQVLSKTRVCTFIMYLYIYCIRLKNNGKYDRYFI